MKRIFTNGAIGAFLMLLGTSSIAQTDLLVGHRGNGTTGQENLEIVDTTGGGFVITSTMALSSDSITDIEGLYGMALQPFTNELYCVYGGDGSSSNERRLGILDPTDASIRDLGVVGTVNDITFLDAQLFGSTGSAGDYMFGTIDTATAVFTEMFQYSNANSSNGFTYDYHKNRFLKTTQGASDYEVIDPLSFVETSLPAPSHPGWTTTLLTINDSLAYSMGNDIVNILNTNTFEFTFVADVVDNEYIHSSAFTSYPLSLWVNGKRLACADEGTELVIVGEEGAAYEWYMDDELIDGADADTLATNVTGWYYATVDGNATNKVYIEMVDVESPSFVMSANPAFLIGASVEVTCFETVTGDGFTYGWDSGDGETSTDENPTFSYDALGSYDVEFTVTEELSGCTGTSTQTLVVLNTSGINELEIDFNLFPVPASEFVTIQYAGAESYSVELIDMNGAVISNHVITPQGENTIDINELAAGTYFLKITNGTQVSQRKFVKQ